MGEGVLLDTVMFGMGVTFVVVMPHALLEAHAAAVAGTFGRVLECWDRKNKDYCAVKIVRNVKKYRDAAMIEVRESTKSRSVLL
jgi:hypothetical protein